jgi:hypothetical protein
MTSYIRTHLIAASITSIVGIMAAFLYERVNSQPIDQLDNHVVTQTVYPGSDLLVESTVFRHRLCATTIERTIFDGSAVRWDLAPLVFESAPGPLGKQTYRQLIHIPEGAAPGQSYVNIGLRWRCPLADLRTVIGPLPFIIIKEIGSNRLSGSGK